MTWYVNYARRETSPKGLAEEYLVQSISFDI